MARWRGVCPRATAERSRRGLTPVCVVLLVLCSCAFGQNVLPNGSFELVEPPTPTAELAKSGQAAPPDAWLPRTWNLWGQWGAAAKLPDDPAQAHTGARAVQFAAKQGQCWLRYATLPVPDRQPWTVRFWARGQGKLSVGACDATTDQWKHLPAQTVDVPAQWAELSATWTPPEGCTKWVLDFTNQGATECFIDDVTLTHPAFPALALPPTKPLTRDERTLLLLDFEEPLNEDAFYVGGQVAYADEGMPGFGKVLKLGPEAYVACSADENLSAPRGTVEVWVKLMAPGNNNFQQPFVSVPGPQGFWLGKNQYAHVGLGFSSGWGHVSGVTAMGYAGSWQPCWRHAAACWDEAGMQLFVDGKLIGWQSQPKLLRTVGPELRIGAPGMLLDNLRISDVVRYRVPTP